MLTCCQGLLSPDLAQAKSNVKFSPVFLGELSIVLDRLVRLAPLKCPSASAEYDTGPPRESSFVGTVLRRSLCENAPPSSV